MDSKNDEAVWSFLSHEEKNHQLFLKQKALLSQFLEKGAISRAQYDKSLHDLTEKMGEEDINAGRKDFPGGTGVDDDAASVSAGGIFPQIQSR